MPDAQLLTRGKSSGATIGAAGGVVDLDLTVDSGSQLLIEVDMTGAANGDLAVQVNPVSEQGGEVFPLSQPASQSIGPTLVAGRVYFWATYDVLAQQRVRVRITNANVGAQTVDYAWRVAG